MKSPRFISIFPVGLSIISVFDVIMSELVERGLVLWSHYVFRDGRLFGFLMWSVSYGAEEW